MKFLKLLSAKPALVSGSDLADLLNQAAVLEVNKEYAAALAICHQILALDPINIAAYQLRGIVKNRLNDPQSGNGDLHIAQSLLYQSQQSYD